MVRSTNKREKIEGITWEVWINVTCATNIWANSNEVLDEVILLEECLKIILIRQNRVWYAI